ncbi:hypothetical protein M3J09_007725 [Ascochyta lentis]
MLLDRASTRACRTRGTGSSLHSVVRRDDAQLCPFDRPSWRPVLERGGYWSCSQSVEDFAFNARDSRLAPMSVSTFALLCAT